MSALGHLDAFQFTGLTPFNRDGSCSEVITKQILQRLRLTLHCLPGADDIDVLYLGEIDDFVTEARDIHLRMTSHQQFITLDTDQLPSVHIGISHRQPRFQDLKGHDPTLRITMRGQFLPILDEHDLQPHPFDCKYPTYNDANHPHHCR